jgi:hypothetical protein
VTEDELERQRRVLDGHPVVANKRRDLGLIAWAKSQDMYTDIDRTSPWGNRFRMGRDGTREEVCDWYAAYLSTRDDLLAKLGTLRGLVLGCWCYPERCHGDELIRLLSESHRKR